MVIVCPLSLLLDALLNLRAQFAQTLGGCLFASAGQAIYSNKFLLALQQIPGVNPLQIIAGGATSFRRIAPDGPVLAALIQASLNSINYTFLLAAVCAALGFFFALGVENNDVRGASMLNLRAICQALTVARRARRQGRRRIDRLFRKPSNPVARPGISLHRIFMVTKHAQAVTTWLEYSMTRHS